MKGGEVANTIHELLLPQVKEKEKEEKEFVSSARLIFKAQVMRGHVLRGSLTSACLAQHRSSNHSSYRMGNNIAEQMVRAKFMKAEVAA
jgi:hypothetical protein